MRPGTLGLILVVLAAGAVVVGTNAGRFVGWRDGALRVTAQPKIATKELTFLPPPAVAKALTLGHRTTISKLRWIDSFKFFQLQFDRRDDRVAGGSAGAFERLYDTLIGLDPKFLPFYQHAVLNTGGILSHHQVSLGFALRATLELPHEFNSWQMAAAELVTNFKFDERQPESFDRFLRAWADQFAGTPYDGTVQMWIANLGKRKGLGLEQIDYWLDQLRGTASGSPLDEFIVDTVREQLALYGRDRLQIAVDAAQPAAFTALPPRDLIAALTLPALRRAFGLRLLAPDVRHLLPIAISRDGVSLRADPFGFPYRLDGFTVASPGLERFQFAKRRQIATNQLADIAKRTGSWPQTVADAVAAGVALPAPPQGGRWTLTDQQFDLAWPEPPPQPLLDPRALLK